MMRYTCRVADTTKVLIILYFANKQNAHVTRTHVVEDHDELADPIKQVLNDKLKEILPTCASNDGYV